MWLNKTVAYCKRGYKAVFEGVNSELEGSRPDAQRLHYHLETGGERLEMELGAPPSLYVAVLHRARKAKSGGSGSALSVELPSGAVFYANEAGEQPSLTQPPQDSVNLSLAEIQGGIRDANSADEYFTANSGGVVKAQAQARAFLARRRYLRRLHFLAEQDEQVRKIQAHMRRRQIARDYQTLVSSEKPPLGLVRKFADRLRSSEAEYASQVELERLKARVAEEAAGCHRTEAGLRDLDTNIGLLVQNRINLEEVLRQGAKVRASAETAEEVEEGAGTGRTSLDVGGMRRASRRLDPRLVAYAELLYLLQTQPQHLTTLALTKGQSPQAVADGAALPALAYGSGAREEFLLLRLLRHALSVEIKSLSKPTEVSSLSVPAAVVSFFRQIHGESAAQQERLGPIIRNLLAEKTEHINMDPLEVYKYLVSEPSAQMTDLQASQKPQVKEVLERSLTFLETWAQQLMDAVTAQPDDYHYVLRYLGASAESGLESAFPDQSARERRRATADLFFSSCLRPMLLAPENYGLIPSSQRISDDQRKILASLAKLCGYAVENRGFGEDKAYLMPLNDWIRAGHEKVKGWLSRLLAVPDPEERYGLDDLSDLTAPRPPSLTISLGSLHHIHKLVQGSSLAKSGELAPVVKQLGPVPTLPILAGVFCEEAGDEASLSGRKVTLALRAPSAVPSWELASPERQLRHQFTQAKKLATEILLSQSGPNLPALLDTPATSEQEAAHERIQAELKVSLIPSKLINAALEKYAMLCEEEERQTLEERKAELASLLEVLEAAELVSSEDQYQDLVSALAQDIRSESQEREARAGEMERLRRRLADVREKKAYQAEQARAYNAYLADCLTNMAPKTREKRASSDMDPAKRKSVVTKTLKYPGDKLAKKGVLLEIRDVPSNKFGNHKFELSNEAPGVFQVDYRIGDKHQTRKLNFQELLKLDYDGVSSASVFSGVIFDLPKFLLLLNRKFYC